VSTSGTSTSVTRTATVTPSRTEAERSAPAQPKPTAVRTPVAPPKRRRATLRLLRVDPWSVMKLSFLLSIALGVIVFIAVALVWTVLDAMGVFVSVGQLINDVTGAQAGEGFDLPEFLSLSRVLGFTTLVTLANIVLITALATLGAYLYNLASSLAGGLDVVLGDDR
jgi:hypothetical protein